MKPLIPGLAFLFFTLLSCKNNNSISQQQNDKNAEIPKVLQEQSSDVSLSRTGGDMVESLYAELVDKNPELKKIEGQIKALEESKSDSTNAFSMFNSKNDAWYTSAASHLEIIKDSVVRERMKVLINSSRTEYNNITSRHTTLLNTVSAKADALNDMHVTLKLLETMQVLEEYQKANTPSTKSIEGLLKEYDKVLQKVDTLTKKRN